MTPDQITDMFRDVLFITIMIVTVLVLPGLLVGLLVSVFQAATQINEQTLSFLPRLLVTLVALAITAPWFGSMIGDFTIRLFMDIPQLIR